MSIAPPAQSPRGTRPRPPSAAATAATLALIALALTACEPAADPADAAPDDAVSFASDIRPLLEELCVNCHHQGALMGDLNLENRQLALRPRDDGELLVPGEPQQSLFFQVLNLPDDDPAAMPPTGHRIEDHELDLFRRWIEQGAEWPDGADGVIRPAPPVTDETRL